MAVHIIGIQHGDLRARFIQEFTDDAFYKLPYLARYGHPPPKMFAWHLNEGENIENSERVRLISRLPVAYVGPVRADVELVLQQLEREREAQEQNAASETAPAGEEVSATSHGA